MNCTLITGYERDNETNLDYAKARMYGSGFGRFTSPDDFLNDTHVSDPQSWNLYVYVRNNPLRLVDPTGEDIEKNANGTVKFDPDKIDKKTGKPKDSEFIYIQKQRDDGSIVTTKWRAVKGTIYSENNGKVVKIEAFKATTAVSVEVQKENGFVDTKESASLTAALSKSDNSADCHGNTFANGEVWIDNNQVKKLVENEGYTETTKPQKGDIGLYAEGKKFNLNNIQHSVIVNNVTDGVVTDVISKGGITQRATLPTGPGTGTAWDSKNNPNDQKNTQVKYFTKRVQQ